MILKKTLVMKIKTRKRCKQFNSLTWRHNAWSVKLAKKLLENVSRVANANADALEHCGSPLLFLMSFNVICVLL